MSDIPSFIPGGPGGGIKGANDAGRAVLERYGFRSLEEVKWNGRITMWYRLNDKKELEFNHWNFGQDPTVRHPVANHPDNIKAWKGGKWTYRYADILFGVLTNKQEMVSCY